MNLSALVQFISPYHKLLVGFSGGLDSTVLLHRLMLLRNQQPILQLRAIHIHHGLSSHANEWVTHCQSICSEWNIPLIVKHVAVQNNGLGVEGQARKNRYTAFANALLPGEALLTGHHLNDQCETLLLALKRGSGPAGLSAAAARASFAKTQLLRPLLNESRDSLKAWANKHALLWIEDESNQNDAYDRNFLRLRILPLLLRRWPHFCTAVARSAELCAEQETLLNKLLADKLTTAISEEGAIRITALQEKTSVERRALLRRWISGHQIRMPSRDMLTRIWQEVALARSDANPTLHLNGFEIRRYHGQLWCVPCLPVMTDQILTWSNPITPLSLPNDMGHVFLQPNGQLRFPKKNEKVTVRFQAQGTLHIAKRFGGRKIKKIWQEHNIPPWRRKITPLLFYGEMLVAAAGVFITQEGFAEVGMQFTWKK